MFHTVWLCHAGWLCVTVIVCHAVSLCVTVIVCHAVSLCVMLCECVSCCVHVCHAVSLCVTLVADWAEEEEDAADVNVWEDNWDDDNVEDDFSKQLR